ncbi:MAG: STAS domain-containing protein [Acidobacteriia bacterium]|nr:STAS domain-containing protein [Terriglobia bacterium]
MTDVTITQEAGAALVRPGGNVVAASADSLRSAMREAVAGGVREMVVDLTGVEMIDSSGLGVLVSAHNSLNKLGGSLAVVHASKEILDLFRLMRIHQHFSVSGD